MERFKNNDIKWFTSWKLLFVLMLAASSFQRIDSRVDELAAAISEMEEAGRLMENSQHENAIIILQQVIPVFEASKNWKNWKAACHKLDLCFYELELEDDGIAFAREALLRIKNIDEEQVLKPYLFIILADNLLFKGDYGEAISYYEQGIPFAEKTKDNSLLKRYYGTLGRLYWEEGNHAKALDFQQKALKLAYNEANLATVSTLLAYIGDTYRSQKNYAQSINYFRQSLAINPDEVQTWIQFSKAYQDFGKTDSAFWALNRILPLLQADISKADGYYQFARLYHEALHDFPKASLYIRKALEFAEKGYGQDHSDFARINALAGQIYLAANNPDTALTWFHKNLLLQSEGVLEDLDLTQNPTLDQLDPGSYWVLGSLDGKGTAFYQKYKQTKDRKNLEYAIAAFDLALNYGEQMRLSYGHESSKTDLYEYLNPAVEGGIKAAMAMAALEPENPDWQEKAFAFAERVKAAIMAEALHDKDIKHISGIPDSALEKEDLWEDSVVVLETLADQEPEVEAHRIALTDARLALDRIKDSMEIVYPRYYELKYGFQKTVDLAKIRQHLAEDALLVEYFKGDSTLYTFVLSKTTFKAYTTTIGVDFDTTLAQYRRALSDWDYIQNFGKSAERDFMTAAPKLYEWLLAKPLSEFRAKSLVIVPDGALGLISFDALLTAPFQSDWTDPGIPYLIKKYPISYDWSAGAMVSRNREAPEVEYHFGGFGTQYDDDPKPVAMRSDLGPLPNADDEVRDIDALLNGKSWLNEEATKDRFLNYAPRCGILHIATHGILDEETPMQSHLVFNKTGDGAENRLFASELYTLDLHAQMAVLSACNTGSGKIAEGEGNMSIARALSYAGCPTLVSNLWSANDQASAKLMVLFYENLKAGATVDEALQAAKLSYLETQAGSVSLPYYWASFIVVGEPAALLLPQPFNWWLLLGGLLLGGGVLYFLYRRNIIPFSAR